jgi:xyloglucan fucosyltransferase
VDARKAGIDAVFSSAVGGEFSDSEVRRFCFFVTRSRQFLTEPAWLHLSGCHYFLPKLCAVPAFRPVLEVLFPDPSLALTYLLRTLMLPKNKVWEQVKQHDKDLFADVDRRVGIQVGAQSSSPLTLNVSSVVLRV